jgi:peptide/nickel transport system substrate-binding protein
MIGVVGLSKPVYKIVVAVLIVAFVMPMLMPAVSAATQQQRIVRLALAEEISSLNPLVGNSLVDWFIFNLIYDKLAIYDTNLHPRPWLAENWTVTENNTVWILHLVHNATWSDGVPFTAQDVVFTINYIKKHPEIWLWQDEVQYIKSVKALDNYTVEIVTTKPVAILDWYVFPRLPILPKHIWQNITNPTKYPNLHPVGNGPFILVDYKPGQYIKFEANPHYWRGKPHIDGILGKIGLSSDTAFLELEKGQLDIMVLTPEYVKQAEKLPNVKVVTSPDIYFDYVTRRL